MKAIARQVKNSVMQYDDTEILVREATSNDPWGASSTLLHQIADATTHRSTYKQVLNMTTKRLTDYQHLNHVLKALILIDFLLRNGDQRFVQDCKDRRAVIKRLKGYKYFKDNREIGEKVRQWANNVTNLLDNEAELTRLREQAKVTKGKFQGYANGDPMAPAQHGYNDDTSGGLPKRDPSSGPKYDKEPEDDGGKHQFEDDEAPPERVASTADQDDERQAKKAKDSKAKRDAESKREKKAIKKKESGNDDFFDQQMKDEEEPKKKSSKKTQDEEPAEETLAKKTKKKKASKKAAEPASNDSEVFDPFSQESEPPAQEAAPAPAQAAKAGKKSKKGSTAAAPAPIQEDDFFAEKPQAGSPGSDAWMNDLAGAVPQARVAGATGFLNSPPATANGGKSPQSTGGALFDLVDMSAEAPREPSPMSTRSNASDDVMAIQDKLTNFSGLDYDHSAAKMNEKQKKKTTGKKLNEMSKPGGSGLTAAADPFGFGAPVQPLFGQPGFMGPPVGYTQQPQMYTQPDPFANPFGNPAMAGRPAAGSNASAGVKKNQPAQAADFPW